MKSILHSVMLLLFVAPVFAADTGVWIDVRTAAEYNEGHVKDAINIPHKEIAGGIGELGLARDARINLYCGSGGRAGIARQTLEKLGYTNVRNAGGYKDIVVR